MTTERAVNAMGVVIVLVFVQLARQVHGIPEEYAVKILTPHRSDQPFDERMRDWSVPNRLNLLLSVPKTSSAFTRGGIEPPTLRFQLPGIDNDFKELYEVKTAKPDFSRP
jgi:hypothetical protein